MKRRLAQLPLHSGKTPPWLFKRNDQAGRRRDDGIVDQLAPPRCSAACPTPVVQAFGCVLGFDWHSSGVTTVTCGALKEAAKVCGPDWHSGGRRQGRH